MRNSIFAAAIACTLATGNAHGQHVVERVELPAQPLASALQKLGLIFRRNISFANVLVESRNAPELHGDFTFEDALARLLHGSGLRIDPVEGGFAIRATGVEEPFDAGQEILVTGSRIRGAEIPSPIIRLERESMQNAGQSSLADVMRSVPQNFGGGQNPGIGFNVPEGNGADVSGGASVNLRGLGSDATLTLLNGHRLTYSAARQSVDISSIPFGAIARVEIVPDGASAIFGSDAVAGVVNILLREDLSGLEASAQVGASTDGGNVQQQYGLTGGSVWRSGSVLLAYEYGRSTAIEASERDYASDRTPGVTLYPALSHHNAALVLRQEISPDLRFALDGLVNFRRSDQGFPLNPAGDLAISSATTFSKARSFGLAPSLTLRLPGSWEAVLAGSWGRERVDYGGDFHFGSATSSAGSGTYRNAVHAGELSGSGALAALPGGDAKLALGAGYRRNHFERVTSAGAMADASQSQDSHYAFAELNLPLMGGARHLSGIEKLVATGALRYERYPGIASVVTPKLGLVWAPVRGLSVKGSWGRSFRAPTLYQQYQPRAAYVTSVGSVGGTGFPPGSTALRVEGGNPDLKPERSTNWSATLAFRPEAVDGLELEFSYFSVRYRDRIVTPIPFVGQALSDPLYANQITRNPDAGALDRALAGVSTFTDLTGSPIFDRSRVVAIVENSSINAGRQDAEGLDILVSYRRALGRGTIGLTGNASYLTSRQRISEAQPTTRLAGILFNPPNLRFRSTLTWQQEEASAVLAVSRIGGVRDERFGEVAEISGMMPVDLTLRYRGAKGRRLLDGLDLTLSIQNLFNAKPAAIAIQSFIDTPYDSTNYSPFGRVLSLGVTKSW